MEQSIRHATSLWHSKTQAQVWRKQLLNHTIAQLPLAAVNNKNTRRGPRETVIEKQMVLTEEREHLRTKRNKGRSFGTNCTNEQGIKHDI